MLQTRIKSRGERGGENGGEGDEGEGDNAEGIELFSRIRDFDECDAFQGWQPKRFNIMKKRYLHVFDRANKYL